MLHMSEGTMFHMSEGALSEGTMLDMSEGTMLHMSKGTMNLAPSRQAHSAGSSMPTIRANCW